MLSLTVTHSHSGVSSFLTFYALFVFPLPTDWDLNCAKKVTTEGVNLLLHKASAGSLFNTMHRLIPGENLESSTLYLKICWTVGLILNYLHLAFMHKVHTGCIKAGFLHN